MDSERVSGSSLTGNRQASSTETAASAAQKATPSAARVDPNQSNANASGVAAAASGMSLFFAFDRSSAAEVASGPAEDASSGTGSSAAERSAVPPSSGTEAPGSSAPAAAPVTEPAAQPTAAGMLDPIDTRTVAQAPERGAGRGSSGSDTTAGAPPVAAAPAERSSAPTDAAIEPPLVAELSEDSSPVREPDDVPNLYGISAIADVNAAIDSVDESAAIGSSVGIRAQASDGDAADSVTYSLVDDAGGLFAINASTGEVTLAGVLDFETVEQYVIEVMASSSDGSVATMSYVIAVNDANEVAVSAISDSDASTNAVAENAVIGTSVGITALATDADGTASVSYSLSDDAGGLFAIDPTTGEITVAGALDRGAAASYQIEVTATSTDGSTSTQSYSIALNDQDEFDVSPVADTNAAADTLAENAAAGTAVGIVASASDADATGNAVTYSVDDDRFTVDADGTVRVAAGATFDHETEASIGITVTATSADGSSSSQAFTLSVSDVNEAAVSAISDTDAAGNAVAENAVIGTSVGITALATDADGTASVSYSLSDDAGGLFAIDPTTGEITVAGALDREAAASYQIEVTATSTDGSTSTQSYTIALNDQDEFDVSPVSDTNLEANGLAESAAAGTAVGIVASASDADATSNVVTYSVDDDRFTVDADGTVRVAAGASFDHETEASVGITVTATSADGSSSSQAFTLAVSDVNEAAVSAISDSDGSANVVSENAAIGTSVGITALATDADGTASVSYSLSDDAGGLFAIDPTTGEITVAGALDREVAASYQIEVTATSTDGSTSTQSYSIALNDQDEFNVTAIGDSNAAANTLAENAAAGTAVGIVASATDADATSNAVTYSVDDDRFTVDADGTVRVAAGSSFDHETEASIGITVTATSADGSSSSQAFTLVVSDVNEAAVSAISDTNAAGNAVAENAAIGTSVGITALATDADGTASVSYSLSDDAGGLFAIDPTTGEITVAGALDREAAASYQIEVTATSTDGSTSTQSYTIALNDQDEFDVSPVSDTNAASNAVTENATIGTTVGVTAFASDGDATTSGVTYSLTDSAGGKFAINSSTGVVTVAGAIDREAGATQTITVQATSADGSTSTQSYTIAVNDQDEFNVTAISDSNAASNAVNETAAIGSTVGITASATDADATTSGITYSLTDNAGGKFAINSSTGVVTVAGALDFETTPSHSITVKATSADGSSSTQSYSIGVNDINDESPTDIAFASSGINEEGTGKITFTLSGEKFGSPPLVEVFANGVSLGVVELTEAHDTVAYGGADLSDLEANAQTFTLDLPVGVSNPGTITFKMLNDNWDSQTGYDTNFYVKNVSVGETSLTGAQGTGGTSVDGDWLGVNNSGNVATFAPPSGGWDTTQIVGTLSTTDADASNSFTYTLTSDPSGLFAISGDKIIVKSGMETNFEAAASHNVTVQVNDGAGHTYSKVVTIAVNDIEEPTAPTDLKFTPNSAIANSTSFSAGQTLFSVASVADVNAGNTFTYSLATNPYNAFQINATTGAISLVNTTSATNSTVSLTVKVTDSDGLSYNEVVTIYSGDNNGNSVTGGNGTSLYLTAAGNDTIRAGSGEDMILSGQGEDTVSAGGGDDIVYMGDGNDVFDTAGSTMDDDGNDYIDGGAGADTIYAGGGNDTLIGGSGNDYLYGEDGNDTLNGGAGNDLLEGGAGIDTADYSTSSAAVTINLGSGAQGSGGDAQGDTLSSIENVTGSIYNDTLTGDGNANVLSGGDGQDVLTGGGGNDTLVGGAGVDQLYGGDGADRLEGGSGNDTIYGGTGDDSVDGGSGDDTIFGEDGSDTISGGGGADTIQGGAGDDSLTGSAGNDTLSGGSGSDTFIYSAGDGSDSVSGGAGGGWTDMISLQGMDGAIQISGQTITGDGWTMALDNGSSITSQSGESLTLSNDADGTITFDDGSTLTFTDIEKVSW